MKTLPMYYDAGRVFKNSSTKTITQTTKRTKWIKEDNLQNEHFKIKKGTIGERVRNTTVKNKKAKITTYHDEINKRQHDDTIPFELLQHIQNNEEVYNKQEFINWLWIKYTKKNKFKKSINKQAWYKNNYYKGLFDKRVVKATKDIEQEQINNTYTLHKMPLLTTKKNEEFKLDPPEEACKNTTYNEHQKEDEWTVSNYKEIAKDRKSTTEPTSLKYLPRTILKTTAKNQTECPTKLILAISIKMISNKQSNSTFKPSRVLAGVLGCMQHAFKDTYLGPIENDMHDESKLINDIDDIPTEEGAIKQYLATPVYTKPNMFIGKVFCSY
jgi:hypothetical protein